MSWKLTHQTVVLKLRHAFTISTGSSTERMTVVVRLLDNDGRMGLGEATPVRYLGGTPEATDPEVLDGPSADGIDDAGAHGRACGRGWLTLDGA